MIFYLIFQLFILNSILVSIKSQTRSIRVGSPFFSSFEGKESASLRPTYNVYIHASSPIQSSDIVTAISRYMDQNTCIRVFNYQTHKVTKLFGVNFERENFCKVIRNKTVDIPTTIKIGDECFRNFSVLYKMTLQVLGVPYKQT